MRRRKALGLGDRHLNSHTRLHRRKALGLGNVRHTSPYAPLKLRPYGAIQSCLLLLLLLLLYDVTMLENNPVAAAIE